MGSVTDIKITNGGAGYLTAPAVTVSAPGGGGDTATAVARIGVHRSEHLFRQRQKHNVDDVDDPVVRLDVCLHDTGFLDVEFAGIPDRDVELRLGATCQPLDVAEFTQ